MLNLNIVILAAGAGTRMRSSLPKVLHHMAGKSLLQHVIDTARLLSPSKIFVVYGHGGETVKQATSGNDLVWIEQREQLGTGHALQQAESLLDQDGLTLVLYGDVPLARLETLSKLINTTQNQYCALLTATLQNPDGYGRIVRDPVTKEVAAIVEQKDANIEQLKIQEINTGIMIIPNRYLHQWLSKLDDNNEQKEYYLTDIIAMAVNQGVSVISSCPADLWETMGVNSKRQLAELERIYQREIANKLLDQGVTLADPNRIEVRGDLLCGSDVEIDIDCIFEGTVHLADHVKIKGHCTLKNVKVSAGTIIDSYSLIEEAEIGERCKIGPYARIRPGTKLADHVHIGNFVEVKNSQIASGSKANHLSYIGDTIMGEKVNIGAGTITCNYDGANKYKTIIEDHVFVGSDTQLVAPVTVAKGSTIGAGSTITKDTPADTLSLSRPKQISIAGWRRPVKQKK